MTEPHEQQKFKIEGATPEMLTGVYANYAAVNHSPFEFTLDFIRRDFSRGGSSGPLVARINMSPLFVRQLIDMLQTNWEKYAEKAMPPEARSQPPAPDPHFRPSALETRPPPPETEARSQPPENE